MTAPEKNPRLHGPFLIQGDPRPGGELLITCKEGGEYTMFSIRFFNKNGKEIARVIHRPPPRIAYVQIPLDAGSIVLRSPQNRAVIQVK